MNAVKTTSILLLACIFNLSSQSLKAQSPAADADALSLIKTFEIEGCGVLEVSKEMFEILSKDDRASEEVKETFSQIDHLVFLNCFAAYTGKERENFDLTKEFKDKAEGYHFKLLMRSEDSLTSSHFYRRNKGAANEYLLVTKTTIQYVATELNIMSIRDLKDILNITGDAGGL